jgi:hypothetical protein
VQIHVTFLIIFVVYFRPKPVDERPRWLDDPRGAYGRPDVLPEEFPRSKGGIGSQRVG